METPHSVFPESFTERFPLTIPIAEIVAVFPDLIYRPKAENQELIAGWMGMTREIWGDDIPRAKFLVMQVLAIHQFEEAIGYNRKGLPVSIPPEDLIIDA